MAPLPRATPPGPAGPSWYTGGYGCHAIRKFSIVSRPSRMRCVSSDRFFRRKHALPLPWRTRGRAPRVSVRARSLPLPSGPYAPCGVRFHADPPDAPPPASRCSRHPATHSSFPHRPGCNRWAGQGAAGRPIPSHHSDCVRCRIPANSSRLTAGPFAKQAYIHLFTRPICRASEYVTGTTLAGWRPSPRTSAATSGAPATAGLAVAPCL